MLGRSGGSLREEGPARALPPGLLPWPGVLDRPRLPHVVAVVAHPGDEVLLHGSALAAAALRGCPVTVVTLTDGEGAALPRGALTASLDQLRAAGARRLGQLHQACEALGGVRWRGANQGWLQSGIDSGHVSRWLTRQDAFALAEVVAVELALLRADVVLTGPEDGATGHPDHVLVAAAVRLAVELLRERGHEGVRLFGLLVPADDVRAARPLHGGRRRAAVPDAVVGHDVELATHVLPDGLWVARRAEALAAYAVGRRGRSGRDDGWGEGPAAELLVLAQEAGLRRGHAALYREHVAQLLRAVRPQEYLLR